MQEAITKFLAKCILAKIVHSQYDKCQVSPPDHHYCSEFIRLS